MCRVYARDDLLRDPSTLMETQLPIHIGVSVEFFNPTTYKRQFTRLVCFTLKLVGTEAKKVEHFVMGMNEFKRY